MVKKKKAKKPSTRLSRELKKNYELWLDWLYYGQKITEPYLDPDTNQIEEFAGR